MAGVVDPLPAVRAQRVRLHRPAAGPGRRAEDAVLQVLLGELGVCVCVCVCVCVVLLGELRRGGRPAPARTAVRGHRVATIRWHIRAPVNPCTLTHAHTPARPLACTHAQKRQSRELAVGCTEMSPAARRGAVLPYEPAAAAETCKAG